MNTIEEAQHAFLIFAAWWCIGVIIAIVVISIFAIKGGYFCRPSLLPPSLFPTPHRPEKATKAVEQLRTANAGAEARLSALISANAPNIAEVPNDEWFVICPIGEFQSPDKTYTQVCSREQLAEVARTWNSISGTFARYCKNKWHKLTSTFNGTPGWDGHPETDKARWPVERLLCEVTDLRVTDDGLEGKVTWNEKGMERRTRGPLYPSPIFWHMPPNQERKVFPALLESIGLVPTPNITSVPAWTQNASPDATANNQTNPMNEEQLKALRKSLNLPETTSVEKVIETAQSAFQLSTSNATALQTANTEKSTLENDLKTANSAKEKAEADLKTANSAKEKAESDLKTLSTANSELAKGVVSAFELAGKVTPAQRDAEIAKFTANGANVASLITELTNKKPEMNTKHVEIGGARHDISTANARQAVVQELVTKRMKSDECDYDTAYAKVSADPANKQLFDAMEQPKSSAA